MWITLLMSVCVYKTWYTKKQFSKPASSIVYCLGHCCVPCWPKSRLPFASAPFHPCPRSLTPHNLPNLIHQVFLPRFPPKQFLSPNILTTHSQVPNCRPGGFQPLFLVLSKSGHVPALEISLFVCLCRNGVADVLPLCISSSVYFSRIFQFSWNEGEEVHTHSAPHSQQNNTLPPPRSPFLPPSPLVQQPHSPQHPNTVSPSHQHAHLARMSLAYFFPVRGSVSPSLGSGLVRPGRRFGGSVWNLCLNPWRRW